MEKNNRKFMPKTPKEKGLFAGALVCIGVFTFSLIFITIGIGIIPFLIIAILAIFIAMGLALYARKLINARLKEEELLDEPVKEEKPVQAKEPEPVKKETIPEPAPVERVVEPEPEPVKEPVFKEEPTPVPPASAKKSNKLIFAIVIPIVSIALVAAVAIPVAIHFANNNNEIRDDGGGKNTSKNNGGKVSFNITATTRYEETSDGRVDGYQFEPNKDYIEYRFILSDAGWYVEWIDYGKWSFDASTGYVSAICTNYDTYNVNGQMTNKTYSEGAANAQKSFQVINDTTLYWNGNSKFVAKKVSNFTHPIVIFQERP